MIFTPITKYFKKYTVVNFSVDKHRSNLTFSDKDDVPALIADLKGWKAKMVKKKLAERIRQCDPDREIEG